MVLVTKGPVTNAYCIGIYLSNSQKLWERTTDDEERPDNNIRKVPEKIRGLVQLARMRK